MPQVLAMGKPTVLITGCSEGGFGYALAKSFADQGFFVFATARDTSRVASLSDRDDVEVLSLDVTSQESIRRCVAHVSDKAGGRLDVLVNNAGSGALQPLLDHPIEEAKKIYDVNIWGTLALIQAFSELLIEAKGTIVNVSSIAGVVHFAWQGWLWPASPRKSLSQHY
jgi:1-acylglycerone phosphate reductase